MKPSKDMDYFGLYGYRAMALAVIEQALSDLVQVRDAALRREALEWIEFDPPTGEPRTGLTFAECIEAAGVSSACEVFRQRCRTEPEKLKKDLHSCSTALQCESRVIRNAELGAKEIEPVTFDSQALLAASLRRGAAPSGQPHHG